MAERDPAQLFPHDYLLKPLLWFIPSFVRPNHLTVARMCATPVVLWFLFMENYRVGVPLFIATAATDALDGSLARWRKQITEWGTFYDPMADKLLMGSVIVLILIQHVNPVIAFGVIGVELLMLGGGWYKRQKGKKIQANVWGKVKMWLEPE